MIKSLLLLSLITPLGHAKSEPFVQDLEHRNTYNSHQSLGPKVFSLKIKSLLDNIDESALGQCFEKKRLTKSFSKGPSKNLKCRSKLKKITERYLFCRRFIKILKLYGVFSLPESDNEKETEDLDFEDLVESIYDGFY